MNNLPPNHCIVDKEEFQGMVKNRKKLEDQHSDGSDENTQRKPKFPGVEE